MLVGIMGTKHSTEQIFCILYSSLLSSSVQPCMPFLFIHVALNCFQLRLCGPVLFLFENLLTLFRSHFHFHSLSPEVRRVTEQCMATLEGGLRATNVAQSGTRQDSHPRITYPPLGETVT